MRHAKTQKRKDLFASAAFPSKWRVMQWPTSTGVKLAASVFGLDARRRTFHNGGFSFALVALRVATMIYAASASGAVVFCSPLGQRAILSNGAAALATMAKANDTEQWGGALRATQHRCFRCAKHAVQARCFLLAASVFIR